MSNVSISRKVKSFNLNSNQTFGEFMSELKDREINNLLSIIKDIQLIEINFGKKGTLSYYSVKNFDGKTLIYDANLSLLLNNNILPNSFNENINEWLADESNKYILTSEINDKMRTSSTNGNIGLYTVLNNESMNYCTNGIQTLCLSHKSPKCINGNYYPLNVIHRCSVDMNNREIERFLHNHLQVFNLLNTHFTMGSLLRYIFNKTKETARIQMKIEKLNEENYNLTLQNTELQEKVETLESKEKHLEDQISVLNTENAELKRKLQEMTDKLNEYTKIREDAIARHEKCMIEYESIFKVNH